MDKKKISYLILLCLFSLSCTLQAEKYETVSPNGKLKIKLKIDKGTQYEVWYDNTQLILPSPIGLHLADGRVIGNGSVKSVKKRKVNQTIDVLVGKNKELQDTYNELTVSFNDSCDLVVRAMMKEWPIISSPVSTEKLQSSVKMPFSTLLPPQPSIIRNAMLIIPAKRINPDVPIRYIKDIETLKDSIKSTKVRWKFLTNVLLFLRYYTNIPILPIKWS